MMNPPQNLVWMSRLMLLRTHQEGIKRFMTHLNEVFWAEQDRLPRWLKNGLRMQGKETSKGFLWWLGNGARVRVPRCQMWECLGLFLISLSRWGAEGVGLKKLSATTHQK